MTLAAVLGIFLLSPLGLPPVVPAFPSQDSAPSASSAQSPASQGAPAAPATPANPTAPPKAKPRHKRKSATPNCLDPAGKPSSGPASSASVSANSAALKPCPPKKTVVRNGGAEEPPVQLTGTDPAKPSTQGAAAQQLAATEGNLKKLSARELNADQQQTLNQIREFMEQSRQATAAGDLERAQNLASKARLLSDELVKP